MRFKRHEESDAVAERSLCFHQSLPSHLFIFSALGGAWFPLDVAGEGFAQIGGLLPSAWAMAGFQNIILRGLGSGATLLPAGVILAWAAAFFCHRGVALQVPMNGAKWDSRQFLAEAVEPCSSIFEKPGVDRRTIFLDNPPILTIMALSMRIGRICAGRRQAGGEEACA